MIEIFIPIIHCDDGGVFGPFSIITIVLNAFTKLDYTVCFRYLLQLPPKDVCADPMWVIDTGLREPMKNKDPRKIADQSAHLLLKKRRGDDRFFESPLK